MRKHPWIKHRITQDDWMIRTHSRYSPADFRRTIKVSAKDYAENFRELENNYENKEGIKLRLCVDIETNEIMYAEVIDNG